MDKIKIQNLKTDITVELTMGMHNHHWKYKKYLYYDNIPLIVWVKNGFVVHAENFPTMESANKAFRSFVKLLHNDGAIIFPSHESLVGSVIVAYEWRLI